MSKNNLNDILKKIKQQAVKALQTEGAIKGKEIYKKQTDELLYKAQEPKDYERTYELRDSISSENYMGDKVRLFFDSDKINPYSTEGWGQHQSLDGQDQSDKVADWMNDGHGGAYEQSGLHMKEATLDEIRRTKMIEKVVKDGLKKSGFKVK